MRKPRFGEDKEVAGSQIQQVEVAGSYDSVVKLRPIVMLKSPITIAAQFRSFPPNVLAQSSQKVTAVLIINSLTLRDKLPVHNHTNVKENHQHAPG